MKEAQLILNEDGKTIIEAYGNFKHIDIPDSIAEIGDISFRDTDLLESINIPISVTRIGTGAFWNCISLQTINIPCSVIEIGDSLFDGCSSLKEINVAPSNPLFCSENGILYDKVKKSIIRFPEAKKDSSFIIPDTITEIGSGAFCDCNNLKIVEIPHSVSKIGDSAFFGCSSLEEIHSHIFDPSIFEADIDPFNGINKNTCIFYVPTGTLEKYCSQDVFKDFKNIRET